MFALLHGVLLAPLPYATPDRLVSIGLESGSLRIAQPPALFATYQHQTSKLDTLGYYRIGNANIGAEGARDVTERVTATWVTSTVIPMLGVAPLMGRPFTADEERRNETGAVVLSEAIWRSQFGARPDMLGQTLMVNSVPRVVIAIMPAHFSFPTADTRIWLPVRTSTTDVVGDFSYTGIARLANAATTTEAQTELTSLLPNLASSFPRLESGGATIDWLHDTQPRALVQPLLEDLTGNVARSLWMLGAAGALVLLVAWANVVNLMLMRADARQLEWSVRATLGAGRLSRGSFILGESAVLAAASGTLAIGLVYGALQAFLRFGPADLPRLAELRMSGTTLGFMMLLTMAGVFVMTAVPLLRLGRADLANALRDHTRSHSSSRVQQQLRTAMVVIQIGMALLVSLGSVLLLSTVHRLGKVDPGFETKGVTVTWTLLPFARFDDTEAVAFHEQLTERVRQLPFVQSAGLIEQVPLNGSEPIIQRFRLDRDGQTTMLASGILDEGYFPTMNIPVVAGSTVTPANPHHVVINQSAAATLFGDARGISALGRQLTPLPSGPTYTIVGVVGDVRDESLAKPQAPTVYRRQYAPTDPDSEPGARRMMALLIRSDAPMDLVIPATRKIVYDLDPSVPIFNVDSLDRIKRSSTARLTLVLALMTIAASITLALSAIGLYGVMAYMVALRSREFGMRLALGANPTRIVRLVASRGLLVTATGIGCGLALYALAVPALHSFLFDVTPTDPQTLATAIGVLLLTATAAIWLPARNAARIDPADAIRAP
ncbi:MAG: ABC transporter permease [Ahniella sp.]|nr:ABC transporter permease [Ahniella sp.]